MLWSEHKKRFAPRIRSQGLRFAFAPRAKGCLARIEPGFGLNQSKLEIYAVGRIGEELA